MTGIAAGPCERIQKANWYSNAIKNKIDFNLTLIWATSTEIFNAILKWYTCRHIYTWLNRGEWSDSKFIVAGCYLHSLRSRMCLGSRGPPHFLPHHPHFPPLPSPPPPFLPCATAVQPLSCQCLETKPTHYHSITIHDKLEENLSATFPLIWYS